MPMLIAAPLVEVYDTAALGAQPTFEFDAERAERAAQLDAAYDARVEAMIAAVVVGVDLARWPTGWRKPSKAILDAVAAASVKYDVPAEIIFAVIRKESGFDPKLRGYKALKASYARNHDHVIPKSGGMTWGQKFSEDEWRAYGVCQVVPFNLYGVPGLFKASEPISALFEVRRNVLAGARVLKLLYDKYGTWEDAVWKYNGSRAYQREVFAFLGEYRAAQAA